LPPHVLSERCDALSVEHDMSGDWGCRIGLRWQITDREDHGPLYLLCFERIG
jgi:hypothetical protein